MNVDAGNVDRLVVKTGATPTARDVRALDTAIDRTVKLPGIGVRRRVLPWGTITNYSGSRAGSGSAPIFRPAVRILKDTAEVRWSGPRALIGGVAPAFGKIEIFDGKEIRSRPAVMISDNEVNAIGEVGIYFRVQVDTDFQIRTVTPIASADLPDREPYVAHKLALFLRIRRGKLSYVETDDRELFSGQGFLAVLRRTTGLFEPLFWAKF